MSSSVLAWPSTITSATLSTWRRNFHRYPEIGWSEFFTTAQLATELRSLGLNVLLGPKVIHPDYAFGRRKEVVEQGLKFAREQGTDEALLAEMDGYPGCVALFDTGLPGPTIALRFDIDCVAVDENHAATHRPVQEAFTSQRHGLMHACGHDGHMAIGLAIAHWLVANATSLCGRVKLLFQPAEEGVRGARAMAESGIVDDADYFLAMHLGFIANSGEVVLNPTHFLCTTKSDFRFYGAPAHAGAEPEQGKNALAGACHAAMQMLGISRHGQGMSRINVGVIRAGEGRNVIPASGELQVEVRGENAAINRFMGEQVCRMAEGAAHSYQLTLETEIMGEAVDLTNDAALITLLADVVNTETELTAIPSKVFGGSEDATILAQRVQQRGGQALYFVVGADRCAGHHQAGFDFDEQSLVHSVRLLTNCLQRLLVAR